MLIFIKLEPLGSVPPKITNLHDKFQVLQVKLAEDYAMQCPGQAYPVPFVRLVNKNKIKLVKEIQHFAASKYTSIYWRSRWDQNIMMRPRIFSPDSDRTRICCISFI